MGAAPIKSELVSSYLDRFPEAQSMTIARKIYGENKLLFKDVEAVRSVVRMLRNKMGASHSHEIKNKTHYNDQPKKIIVPSSMSKPWAPFVLPKGRWGILADIHFPYHDRRALEAAVNDILKENCTGVLINGDGMDFYGASKFNRVPNQKTIRQEIQMMLKFLKDLGLPVVYKAGNHEKRLADFVCLKAMELFDLPTIHLPYLLQHGVEKEPMTNPIDITYIDPNRVIYSNHLTFYHGHEYGGMTNSPVNPARSAFVKSSRIVSVAHEHRPSENTVTDIRGKLITTWSSGCLCGLHPDWKPLNQWGHGHAIHDNRDPHNWTYTNKRIYNGRVM